MNEDTREFVVVVHPDQTKPESLINALRKDAFIPVNVVTYDGWLRSNKDNFFAVLFVRKDGSWKYLQGEGQREAITSEIERALKDSLVSSA